MLIGAFSECRMATDLNLHRRTAATSADTAEGRARDREVRNRERTWILCFCLDRSFSAQMGKPYTIKEECVALSVHFLPSVANATLFSFIIRNASQWCRAPNAISSDVALAAYAVRLAFLLGPAALDVLTSPLSNPGLATYSHPQPRPALFRHGVPVRAPDGL